MRLTKAAGIGAVASILCAVILLGTSFASTGEPNPQAFDIRSQGLGNALTEFARQSHKEILFAPELMAQKSSSGVRGSMSPLAALKILLDGTGLSFTTTQNGAILVGTVARNTNASANLAANTQAGLTEVTVSAQREAQRAQLAARIAAFVNEVAVFASDDGGLGLAQWHEPVCPLVSGLPREKGEFILARVSEIARAANVPLAGERCRPNLYVYVTSRPKELLQDMEKRDFAFTFGVDVFPSVVEKFVGTPRTVRVWYNINREKDSGVLPMYVGPENVTVGPVHYAFARVFVVIDERRLGAVSLGQVADYVGLVGLAQLRQGARFDGTPTILTLFDGVRPSAAGGMSDWDRAFLKSLYATDVRTFLPLDLRSKEQRSQIARSMLSELVP
ncbi:MAG TPA: STN domain-containing protein [Steroidobacteraceae bacterium]